WPGRAPCCCCPATDRPAAGATTAHDVVRRVYAEVDEALWPAAELSVRATLDYLATPPR
ncbi:MAG: hypothetical protein WKF50_00570, partial [Nocardioides sp.]